mmetsp:Transcript_13522/g.37357  ORF Transcript_13522/g.37357 Transcript_13522/m.37357 type:complete len:579 (-) Transcript_13522:95-1831(-)
MQHVVSSEVPSLSSLRLQRSLAFCCAVVISCNSRFLWAKTITSLNSQSNALFHQHDWIRRQLRSNEHNQPFGETGVVKCVGTPQFNETCLFRNMYWIQGEKYPTAFVLQNSSAHQNLKGLAPLHLLGVYDITFRLPTIQSVSSEQDLRAKHKNSLSIPGLTVFYDSECPQNVGHGIWDGVWPVFVGLKQLGLPDSVPFQPLMFNFGRKDHKMNLTREITKAISLGHEQMTGEPMNYNSRKRPVSSGIIFRLDLFAMGSGHRGQRNMNHQYSLPGGEYLQSFRDRTLEGFGLPPSHPLPFCSSKVFQTENNQNSLQVTIFDNKRYSSHEREVFLQLLHENQQSSFENSSRLHIQFVKWDNFSAAEQIEIISKTDIYVSGPGTGIVFSPFARDGSVVINLGFLSSSYFQMTGYIDEYFVQGAPHQRGLFYDRCAEKDVTKHALMDLIHRAERIVRTCENFGIEKVADENRSPIVKALRELFYVLGPNVSMKNLTVQEKLKLENDILRGSELHVRPRGRYRLHSCDWAEHVVFETKRCKGIWNRYHWDEMTYRRTVRQIRAKYGLASGHCRFNQTAFESRS